MTDYALAVTDLTKTYKNGFEALKGINLYVKPGEFYGLLGPNGAGKSTTIAIISTLLAQTSGHVKIFGHDIDQSPTPAKMRLGVVPQEFNFGMFEKVFDILVTQAGYYGISASEAKPRAEFYLKKLGLWEKRNVQARMLSGGMKRRLMIARALMHDPKLLILDEPTAGVDIELRRSMWEFLQELNAQGMTIILTTHYLEEAEHLCKRIAIIDRGRIVEDMDIKSLLAQLGTETFIVDLASEMTEPVNVSQDGLEIRPLDPATLEVVLHQGYSLNSVFDLLSQQNILVRSMRNKTNRLEELFVNKVEKHLDTPPGGSQA